MSGIAPIKAEFIVRSDTSGIIVEPFDSLVNISEAVENGGLVPTVAKKPRLRGQNKHRPKDTRDRPEETLCPSIVFNRTCRFGEKCRFLHDVRKYWESKEEDLADRCYVFDNFGSCPFSVACRFAHAHVEPENLANRVDHEKQNAWKDRQTERNKLTKDVQVMLQKRRYNFSKSEAIAKSLTVTSDTTEPLVPPLSSVEPLVSAKEPRDNAERNIDWSGKLYLAPLTTVGNLPFRRICVDFGADITCGEMAMAQPLLQGNSSEWALVKRHESEKFFGVQICGAHVDQMTKCAQLLSEQADIDFIDINMGCPIDLVCEKGAGCMLMRRQNRLEGILRGMREVMPKTLELTIKMRTGVQDGKQLAHNLLPTISKSGVKVFTLHGRSKEQRYTKIPDWNYIGECAKLGKALGLQSFGCGDILSFEDYYDKIENFNVSGLMIARGALIKPWIFTEIKEKRHWDISAQERFEILKKYTNYGLEHWGSDQQGVNKTRRFLLEWLSFLHRYIPIGVLEHLPQRINERPPKYFGRSDLETLMSSSNCADWIKLTEMLLGPVPEQFTFLPKHKANAY